MKNLPRYTLGIRSATTNKAKINHIGKYFGERLIYVEMVAFGSAKYTYPVFYVKLNKSEMEEYINWRSCNANVFLHPLTLEFFNAFTVDQVVYMIHRDHPQLIMHHQVV